MDVGPAELMIVLLIALLIFGGAQLPKLARSMGEAASEFRKGVRGDDHETKNETTKSETTKSEAATSEAATSETAKDQTANEHDGGTEAADVGNERSA